jgi:hypothetical protein
MKNFVKENWYKLMIGSSMMMASFGFMIYAISPAYSNSDKDKTEIKNTGIPNAPVGTNGVIVDDCAYFVDGGFLYMLGTEYLKAFARNEPTQIYTSKGYVNKVPTPWKKELP